MEVLMAAKARLAARSIVLIIINNRRFCGVCSEPLTRPPRRQGESHHKSGEFSRFGAHQMIQQKGRATQRRPEDFTEGNKGNEAFSGFSFVFFVSFCEDFSKRTHQMIQQKETKATKKDLQPCASTLLLHFFALPCEGII